ncbi:MAG: RimK domain-containing protein ATP-grasp [Nannocystaceae bacterium]
MILLWGLKSDGPLAAVREELQRRGAETFFIDQHRVLETNVELTVGDGHDVGGFIELGSQRVELPRAQAIYVRPHDTRRIPAVVAHAQDSAPWRRALQVDDMLSTWSELTEALVISRPSAMASNSSKPYQTERIRSLGLQVPRSLITTDPEAVLEFEREHGTLIYKSISSVRSIVSKLGPEHRERLARIRWCPTQFQEHVPGRDWRAHVVGDRVMACRIETTCDDYRYPGRQGGETQLREDQLPSAIEEACVRVSQGLELPVAGVDLRETPDGRWVCFEVNPSPGFTWYQRATGLPIAEAICDLLEAGAR